MRIKTACEFLQNLIGDCPFKIHRLLTDNGISFTYRLMKRKRAPKRKHSFDKVCAENGIKHKLTKFRSPWTNGQVEVFNRILKEHTTKKYFYEKVKELKEHVMSFVLLYNYQRKLKSLKYLTPYEKIIELYEKDKTCFNHNPHHKILGLNNYA